MFQVDSGRQWFIHAIYSVRSEENSNKGIGKRSVPGQPYHVISSYSMDTLVQQTYSDKSQGMKSVRRRRAVEEVNGVGKDAGKGTNMIPIMLDYSGLSGHISPGDGTHELGTNTAQSQFPMMPVVVALCLLAVLIITVIAIIMFKKKKSDSLAYMHSATMSNPHDPVHVIQSACGSEGQRTHV